MRSSAASTSTGRKVPTTKSASFSKAQDEKQQRQKKREEEDKKQEDARPSKEEIKKRQEVLAEHARQRVERSVMHALESKMRDEEERRIEAEALAK